MQSVLGPFHATLVGLIKSLQIKINIVFVMGAAVASAIIGGLFLAAFRLGWPDVPQLEKAGFFFLVTAGALIYLIITALDAAKLAGERIEIAAVQELAHENPGKPQFAWDLARVKLESYLDRNLNQVRSIFGLTLVVMLCGFGFVLYGLYHAFENPEKLPISIVASASGVIISFIGGSLLLIYRSILSQSKDYVTVLERINAVGMAVHVIASIPDEDIEQKNLSKAELARQLLTLYASAPSK